MKWVRHWRCRRLVGAYVDGELSMSDHRRVLRHFEECADCSAESDLVVLIKASLRRTAESMPAGPGGGM